ncbi:Uncharacterised protein [Mycobacteroides abscessus subsp. abscessus]|nr:Uncharacterised protein [Mycobacteroides abscessus subsp. abscessus]
MMRPGSSSVCGLQVVPWVAASVRNVVSASSGSSGNVIHALSMLSRPDSDIDHGAPAAR